MAAMPPAGGGFSLASAGSFLVNLGASYLLGRLTAQDGPRLQNLEAGGGDYGVAMPRAYGGEIRLTPPILAQADIEEHEHSVEDYSELIGAATGAIQGFMMGGPIGAVAGGILGGLLGAATPDQKFYTYTCTFAVLLADRLNDDPIEGLTKMWAAGKPIFNASESTVVSETLDGGRLVKRKYKKNRWFKSLTVYGGGNVQTVDPILAAAVGEETAYRYRALAVIEDLQLGQFGQSLPSPIEALVAAKANQSLAEIGEAICAAAGIDHELNLSSTALADDVVRGYAVTSETNCWDAIKPLLPVYRVDAAEVAGQIRFYARAQTMHSTIAADDMGSYAYGDSPPELVRFKRAPDLDLPKETAFSFLDPARDYQQNTLSSHRSEGDARSNVSVSVPVVLTADEGASAAAVIHWDAHLGRAQAAFSLTDKWAGIAPGRAYGLQLGDATTPFVVKRKLRGANGIIEIEAVSDESVTYTADEAGTSGIIPDQESTLFADTRIVVMDMPIIGDAHDDYGFYVAVAGTESYWTHGWVEASGNGTTFAKIVAATDSTVIGDVTGTLAAGSTTGLDDTLDTTSVLTVVVLHSGMTLASATDAELDAGANFGFVGKDGIGEYLQWKTAALVAPLTYELTDLRRGRRGTDWAIGLHGAGEEFAQLGQSGVYRIVYADDDMWGVPLTLRGVTLNQDSDDADDVAFTNTGEGKRPYSPVDVEGAWDGSNNLTISFEARSRMNSGELGIDDNEEWEVEITSGAGRVELTATESWVYTAADQATDGLTPGDSVSGRVRQTSDVNDGRWRNFALVGPNALTFDSALATFDETSFTWDAG
jgi:hypothetical protein